MTGKFIWAAPIAPIDAWVIITNFLIPSKCRTFTRIFYSRRRQSSYEQWLYPFKVRYQVYTRRFNSTNKRSVPSAALKHLTSGRRSKASKISHPPTPSPPPPPVGHYMGSYSTDVVCAPVPGSFWAWYSCSAFRSQGTPGSPRSRSCARTPWTRQ